MNRLTVLVLILFCFIALPLGVVAISWDCTHSEACVWITQRAGHALGAFFVVGVLGAAAWSFVGLGGRED